MTTGQLLVSLQKALVAAEAAGLTHCKGVAIYLTPIDSEGGKADLSDPETGAKIDPVKGLVLDAYTGPTAEDANTYKPPA
jgi:hypothetical protein